MKNSFQNYYDEFISLNIYVKFFYESLVQQDLNFTKNTVKNGAEVNEKLCFGGL